MKAKFASPIKIQNLFDGGLYMLGRDGQSFVALALCRAKKEYVINLSPSPGHKKVPGLEPVDRLYAAGAYLSDMDLELFLSPSDILLDPEVPARPGELTVIGEHHYLCFDGGKDGLGFVTFGTGQVQSELPVGPRNRYAGWQLMREVAGQHEVLARFPYRTANVALLPKPKERRLKTQQVKHERRRRIAKPAPSTKGPSPRITHKPSRPMAKTAD